jgi:hypothetical protein
MMTAAPPPKNENWIIIVVMPTIIVEPVDSLMQDVPVHMEMNLREANKRKRRFKPSIPNVRKGKDSNE